MSAHRLNGGEHDPEAFAAALRDEAAERLPQSITELGANAGALDLAIADAETLGLHSLAEVLTAAYDAVVNQGVDRATLLGLEPCGCPTTIVADEGHQEGCEVTR